MFTNIAPIYHIQFRVLRDLFGGYVVITLRYRSGLRTCASICLRRTQVHLFHAGERDDYTQYIRNPISIGTEMI